MSEGPCGSVCRTWCYADRPIALVLALSLIACGERGSAAFVVRHDNEVRVVDNYRPEWNGRSEWTVDASPIVSIPAWSDAKPKSLSLIDSKRLPDGRIVVADANSGEIGFFSKEGNPIKRVGGEGTAPGHFSSLSALHLMDDRLWAFDRMGRWNVFDLEGSLLSTQYFEPIVRGWDFVEPFGVEMAVLSGNSCCATPPAESGFVRVSTPVHRFDRGGAAIDTLTWVPGLEQFVGVGDSGQVSIVSGWSPGPVLHGGRHHLYFGSPETMEITVFGEAKRRLRVMRVPDIELSMSEEELAAQAERNGDRLSLLRAHGSGEGADALEEALARRPRASKPAYVRFIEDSDENLWVARFDALPAGKHFHANDDWMVFDSTGRWLGSVATPEGLLVTEIGGDYVLGIARADEQAVVQLYELKR